MTKVTLPSFLEIEWIPSFGCTEPAAVGFAAALARQVLGEVPTGLSLEVDPCMYKNGFAVGIPNSRGRVGLLWAAALGAAVGDPELRLEVFRDVTDEQLDFARSLLGGEQLKIDYGAEHLRLDLILEGSDRQVRVIVEEEHTRGVHVSLDGRRQPLPDCHGTGRGKGGVKGLRERLSRMPLSEMVQLARAATHEDRSMLMEGIRYNRLIAEHGLHLLPSSFIAATAGDLQSQVGRLAASGVYARMAGEPKTVYAIGGSGNKGITATVPVYLWGIQTGRSEELTLEAVSLSLLLTSAITSKLGPLSAICGCSNAAGIGIACGLVHIQGGGSDALDLAVNNMVGCIAGMICDGAKLGCALKTFAAVDTAFRSAALALAGVGIPAVEGIVGENAEGSIANLGRLARRGMVGTDGEIISMMSEKKVQPWKTGG